MLAVRLGALLLLALATVPACGPCRALPTGASGVNGAIVYVTQDGKTLRTERADLWNESASSVEIRAQLGERPLQILIGGLANGAPRILAHDDTAKACLPIQGGAAPTCLLLEGTVDVKALRFYDCTGNENITSCAEDLELTIHATSKDRGLSLTIDLRVVAMARASCDGD